MRQESPTPELLRRSALFSALPPALLADLLRGAEEVTVARGQRLWASGETRGRVGLVRTGQLKALRRISGRQVLVDVAFPGDVVGDVAFALDEPQRETVVCLRRARVLVVPGERLRAAFRECPRALGAALVSLARRVERLQRQVGALSTGGVPRRLAAALLGLVERAGAPFPGGTLVPLRLRRADLAALAATSAESVSRHLGEWQRRGLLTRQPDGYLVRDLEALRHLADRTTRRGTAHLGVPGARVRQRDAGPRPGLP